MKTKFCIRWILVQIILNKSSFNLIVQEDIQTYAQPKLKISKKMEEDKARKISHQLERLCKVQNPEASQKKIDE